MHVKKYLTIVLTVVLVASFLFGALAPASNAVWPPTFLCQTEFGASIAVSQVNGSLSCADERCFRIEACVEYNYLFECCYRFNRGVCDCICKIVMICD